MGRLIDLRGIGKATGNRAKPPQPINGPVLRRQLREPAAQQQQQPQATAEPPTPRARPQYVPSPIAFSQWDRRVREIAADFMIPALRPGCLPLSTEVEYDIRSMVYKVHYICHLSSLSTGTTFTPLHTPTEGEYRVMRAGGMAGFISCIPLEPSRNDPALFNSGLRVRVTFQITNEALEQLMR